jgi:hypothetical protein
MIFTIKLSTTHEYASAKELNIFLDEIKKIITENGSFPKGYGTCEPLYIKEKLIGEVNISREPDDVTKETLSHHSRKIIFGKIRPPILDLKKKKRA